MALIDEIKFHIIAGKGGNGVVRWLHEKGKEFAGPAGGDGGRGGDVYVEGVSDIALLNKYRKIKEFEAENGEDGRSKSCKGKDGDDLIIKLPVGSLITNLESGFSYELLNVGEKIKILRGGQGGYGNEHFKSSVNIKPKEFTDGKEGEEADFFVELNMIADVGLIGFPNAGKTSILNELTRANSRVGSYPFTTLDPNLGALYEFILADVPGIIEGASEGKGLGHKFLKHIKRTKLLLHCISTENEDLEEKYKAIRNELEKFDPSLTQKEEIVLITKSDLMSDENKVNIEKFLVKIKKQAIFVSILDEKSIKELSDILVKKLRGI